MDVKHLIDNLERSIIQWCPRDMLRRTNWLYRIDALRPRDVREMDTLKELVDLYQTYAEEFIVWDCALKTICVLRPNLAVSIRLKRVIETIAQFHKYLLCEGYCFYMDYLKIAYYSASNRITRSLQGDRFPPAQ